MDTTKELLRKYIKGQCTAAELEQVFELLTQGGQASEWEAVWQEDLAFIYRHRSTGHLSDSEIDQLYAQLLDRLQRNDSAEPPADQSVAGRPTTLKNRWTTKRFWLRATAAVWVFLVAGLIAFFMLRPMDHVNKSAEIVNSIVEIAPGGNRAVLTLADGQNIELNDNQEEIIIDGDVIRYGDGTTALQLSSQAAVNSAEESHGSFSQPSTMLTLATPRGGQYQVRLPDGTNVWLNAASTLIYPSNFDGGERRVALEGEAYFEVATMINTESNDRQPFFVNSAGQEVKVLGTHFNINTYNKGIKTSLLEGSVQVSTVGAHRRTPAAHDQALVLKPGQQSVIHPGNSTIDVHDIDAKSVIAWKEGYFDFSGDLGGILDQIARWYDVDVVYTKNAPEKIRIDGRVSRSMTLNKLLTYLEEATGNVKFDLQSVAGERRIMVK